MITLKTMKFSNIFSYGEDNEVQFDKDPITQLVGKNGHGKSSIGLILEEILFNKNSKGIKKADILNRYADSKSYSIELEFTKDLDTYIIKTTRGTTQTVALLKNGINISAHTATATFKLIEEIIGIDFKTFSQLVYQNSSSSLEFLVATDTNRKKFLIDLLNLGKYTEAFEIFKAAAKEVSDSVLVLTSKVETTKSWLEKHLKEDLERKDLVEVPEVPKSVEESIFKLQDKLKTIDTTNKKISLNNSYKVQLSSLDVSCLSESIPEVESDSTYQNKIGEYKKAIKDSSSFISKIDRLAGVCPTCLQEVNTAKLDELVKEQKALIQDAENALVLLNNRVNEISTIRQRANKISKIKADWENFHSLIDNTLPSDPLDADSISKELNDLNTQLSSCKTKIEEALTYNSKVSAHNSKVSVISEQLGNMRSDLEAYNEELTKLTSRLGTLQILQRTFSTNGLLAYKIEGLVKDLEFLTNEYLSDLSSGRFQLTFKIVTGDKLNVIISDSAKDIDILALSGGERARVNIATLLAIRKLMQSLSEARINLLILDETVETLDSEGKEKLVEVLLKEEYLNTFLVSHGFTHPLLEKIQVTKTNNISRLE
jgi:DNA repair exonuclease SbcCD ATPase subunit